MLWSSMLENLIIPAMFMLQDRIWTQVIVPRFMLAQSFAETTPWKATLSPSWFVEELQKETRKLPKTKGKLKKNSTKFRKPPDLNKLNKSTNPQTKQPRGKKQKKPSQPNNQSAEKTNPNRKNRMKIPPNPTGRGTSWHSHGPGRRQGAQLHHCLPGEKQGQGGLGTVFVGFVLVFYILGWLVGFVGCLLLASCFSF